MRRWITKYRIRFALRFMRESRELTSFLNRYKKQLEEAM